MRQRVLARKPAPDTASARQSSSGLKLSKPGDTFEQEADRVATAVTSGSRVPDWSIARVSLGSVQRDTPTDPTQQQQPDAPKPNNYEDAAKKTAEAFMETDPGKKLKEAAKDDPLVKGATDFVSTLPGKIITGAVATGAVATLAATHKPLPAQIPSIPLEAISPKLKDMSVKVDYEGPVDRPTKAMLTFSYSPGSGDKKKSKESDSDRVRADTARMRADMDKFRAGMTYQPGTPQAEQEQAEKKMIEDIALRRFGSALPGTGGRPLVPGAKTPADAPLQSPLDKHLDLKPAETAPKLSGDAEKKDEAAVQRKSDGSAVAYADSTALNQGLRSPSRPLDAETRHFMEGRIGHDFSKVKIHTDEPAARSARALGALAYTVGDSIVFSSGNYAPQSTEGRRLLAHELTHVVQQSKPGRGARWGTVWRQSEKRDPKADADEFVENYRFPLQMGHDYEGVAHQLFLGFIARGLDYAYVREVILKLADDDWDDNIASNFTDLIGPDLLSQMAGNSSGRLMLDVLYDAMITGSVSKFERKQANRILIAKMKQMKPEDYLKATKHRSDGSRTQIFPVRNMGVTRLDDAPLTAKLLPEGKVWVSYPVRVTGTKMFAAEVKTLRGETFSSGQTLNPNEIVGIKDYESGGKVSYLPAIALIDYSNRVEQHTLGTIAQVAIAGATLGLGAPAAGAARGGVWVARLAFLDKMANVVQAVSLVVNEHRDWIVEKLGRTGEALIRVTEVADTIVAVYGVGRIGQAAFELASSLRSASRAAREEASNLSNLEKDELKVLDEIDSQTNQLAQDMEKAESEAAAANAGEGQQAKPQTAEPQKPGEPPVADKSPAQPGQQTSAVEQHQAAKPPAHVEPHPAAKPAAKAHAATEGKGTPHVAKEGEATSHTKPSTPSTGPEPKFSLHVGKKRLKNIQEGKKNFKVDRKLTFDIDEVLPVGDKAIKPQRAYKRATSASNRQLLDPNTNRYTKKLGIDPRELDVNRQAREVASVSHDPNVLLTHRLSEIEEMQSIFSQALKKFESRRDLSPVKLKEAINKETRRIISEGTGDDAKAVRAALGKLGFEEVENVGWVTTTKAAAPNVPHKVPSVSTP